MTKWVLWLPWSHRSCDRLVCIGGIRDTQDASTLNTHCHQRQPCMSSVRAMHVNTPSISTTQLNRRPVKVNKTPTKGFTTLYVHTTYTPHAWVPIPHITPLHHIHTHIHLYVYVYKSAHTFVLPIREVNRQAIVLHFVRTHKTWPSCFNSIA